MGEPAIQFQHLLDIAPDAMIISDERGKIILANRQVEKLFGYLPGEIVNQSIEMLIPEEFRGAHIRHREQYITEPRTRSMGEELQLYGLRKDKTRFPVEISLSPLKTDQGFLVAAAVRDVTLIKKSEQKFKSLLDAAPDAVIIVDNKGIIQMVNLQTEQLFGYRREDIVGKEVEMLIPPELAGKHVQHRAAYASAPKVRSMGSGLELHAIRKDGTSFPVEISLSPLETEEGMLISAAVRDISERKRLEAELRKTTEEIEAFTYSVSHDLRAPLRGIIGYTTILEEDYASHLDDEGKRITAAIISNTQKMGHLIDDLLAFSRLNKQELAKTTIETSELVNQIIENIIHSQPEKQIHWELGELPEIKADLNTIRQVWINLLQNAVKYSGKKSLQQIQISGKKENDRIVFKVSDNGVGFDPRYSHKLFKVFQRLHADEEFEGTGVGLALVHKIIQRHGGTVWAESTPGEGASFYFSLPVN